MSSQPEGPSAEELRNKFRPLFEVLLGPEGADEVDRLSDDVEGMLATPATFMHKINEAIERAIDGGGQAAKERIVRELARFVEMNKELCAPLMPHEARFLSTPVGLEVVTFLAFAQTTLGDDLFRQLAGPVFEIGFQDIVAPGGAGNVLMDPPVVLEAWVAAALAMHRNTVERFYKTLLQAVLRLTLAIQGKDTSRVSNEVGGVMDACTKAWDAAPSDPWPRLFVDQAWRIARNSDAHNHTTIDLKTGIVTLINKGRKGTETLPVTKPELSTLLHSCVSACISTWLAFRAVAAPRTPAT